MSEMLKGFTKNSARTAIKMCSVQKNNDFLKVEIKFQIITGYQRKRCCQNIGGFEKILITQSLNKYSTGIRK